MAHQAHDAETDYRLTILESLLQTPHRELEALQPMHAGVVERDPRFYVRLGAWYTANGAVRDHKELFSANLIVSGFDGHRDAGLALLREMPPYQVRRVVDFIKGAQVVRWEVERRPAKSKPKKKPGLLARIFGAKTEPEEAPEAPRRTRFVVKSGLFRNPPRALKTEVARYLREREADAEWFDACVLQSRKHMKRLYAALQIKPSAYAQAVLFDDRPPEGSRLHWLKVLAREADATRQAEIIVTKKIPFRVAASAIKRFTPPVVVALVEAMTPQEVINHLKALKKYGALDHPAVKALIERKLEAAQSDVRVSAYKAKRARKAVDVAPDIAEKLDRVTEARVKAAGTITRATAILIDKSGSMHEAIELGKQVGAMLSGICESDLWAYAFDIVPYEVRPKGKEIADWERALQGILAGGGTSCGGPLVKMRKERRAVEQIVVITDEEENTLPHFTDAYHEYAKALGVRPDVIFLRTRGASHRLEEACRRAGVPFSVFQFTGDYYALPNLVPLLRQPSRLDLLLEILDFPLPIRKAK